MSGFKRWMQALFVAGCLLGSGVLKAQAPAELNSIDGLQVTQAGGNVVVKMTLKQALKEPPGSFSIANPARIAFDFPSTSNGLGRTVETVNQGELRSVNVVQVGNRTRVVMNLNRLLAFSSAVEGNALVVTLAGQPGAGAVATAPPAHFAEAKPGDSAHAIRSVNFRRGREGEGRVLVEMSDSTTGIDIRQQGANLIVEFLNTTAPESIQRRLDVTDFATPITAITTAPQGNNVRMVIQPTGLWEHNAYQSDNQFVVEVKRVAEDPNKLVQGGRGKYSGEKLSLNFQNIDIRAVLQVIADFTNLNIITSDTVSGNLTLRLKDVPWDQALDIILQAKGLDQRKSGNVVWIAPRDELAAKEKLELESRAQITDLEPVRTESFQLNYHRATAVSNFLKAKDNSVLSKRGSVVVDERTNKIFVSDVAARLEDVRRLIREIDVAVRQVLIEARIVEAGSNFSRNIGVRFGVHDVTGRGERFLGKDARFTIGGGLTDTGFHTGQIGTAPDFNNSLFSNLAAAGTGGQQVGQFSFILFNSVATKFLNLEISALESDGNGKVISSPRVVTADQVEAVIESGTEIPYQQATSSGATSVSFRKANLALKVKPQITPDGRIMMALDVNKDTPNTTLNTGSGVAIDTRHVKTEVLVENGGTVVIGGVFELDERKRVDKIPLLGDIPVLGHLFRTTQKVEDKRELLVFITPKVVSESLTLR